MRARHAAYVAAFVLLLTTLTACEPRFNVPVCDQYLPGTQVLADIDASGIPIVCEARLAGAPANAVGWWDGTTIHIWPPGTVPQPDNYVIKTAEHEYGHAMAQWHANWLIYWQALRATSDPEDFPEAWAWCLYPHEAGVGYRFTGSFPSAYQCSILQLWYPSR